MWICVFNETDTRFWLRQDTGAMNRPLRLTECSHPISWVYVECFAEYSPRIHNPFRMHSRNVRNVFVICMLHIRRVKVWFLACKKGVFTLQKYGFCVLNVVLLQFVRNVIAIRSQRNGNPSATFWQSVCNVLAIRQQHFGNPSAAVGVRFIAPAYIYSPPILCVFG